LALGVAITRPLAVKVLDEHALAVLDTDETLVSGPDPSPEPSGL
jgi:hypothetical protein